jgi:ribokinase
MDTKYDLLCIGDIMNDITLNINQLPNFNNAVEANSFSVTPGGSGANTAIAAARMGLKVAFCGVFGSDFLSMQLIDVIENEHIDLYPIHYNSQGVAGVTLIRQWEKTYITYKKPQFAISKTDLSQLPLSKGIHLVGYICDGQAVHSLSAFLNERNKNGSIIFFDTAEFPVGKYPLAKVVNHANYLFTNDSVSDMLEISYDFKIIKKGKKGSIIIDQDGNSLSIKAYPLDCIDPSGAGDSYDGVFISMILKGEKIEKAGKLASIAGAITVKTAGAQPGFRCKKQLINISEDLKSNLSFNNAINKQILKMKKLPNIALFGQMGSGKSTLAHNLVNELGYKKISIGQNIKKIAKDLFPDLILSPPQKRVILQKINQFAMEIDPEIWVKKALSDLNEDDGPFVIDDARHITDFSLLKKMNWLCFGLLCPEKIRKQRIQLRDNYLPIKEILNHSSEKDIAKLIDETITIDARKSTQNVFDKILKHISHH